MDSNGRKWTVMDENGRKWAKMDENGRVYYSVFYQFNLSKQQSVAP